MDTTQAITSIATQVFNLPGDVNPYSWLKTTIRDEVLPSFDNKWYTILLWIAVASLCIALLSHLATIYFRIRGKVFWLFRANNEGYLVPNVACSFACGGVLYCIMAIASQCQLALYMLPHLRKNLFVWPIISFLCLTLSAWVEVWSTAVAVLTYDGSPTPTPKAKNRLSPRLFNAIFAGLPILYLSMALIMVVPFSHGYNNIMDSIRAVFDQLDKSAAEWTSGPISLTVLQQLSRQLGSSESGFKDIAYWQKAIECYEISINSALLLVWAPLLITTLKQLRKQIKFINQTKNFSIWSEPAAATSLISNASYTRKLDNLVAACRQRILNAAIGYCMGLCYVAICAIPIAAGSDKVMGDPKLMQIFVVGGALIYSVFGTPTSVTLAYVSYKTCKRQTDPAIRTVSIGLTSSRSKEQALKPAYGMPQDHLQQHVELSSKIDPVKLEEEL